MEGIRAVKTEKGRNILGEKQRNIEEGERILK